MKTFDDLKPNDILYNINFGTDVGGMRIEEHKVIEIYPCHILVDWLVIVTELRTFRVPPAHINSTHYHYYGTDIEDMKKLYIQLSEEKLKTIKEKIESINKQLYLELSAYKFISDKVKEYKDLM